MLEGIDGGGVMGKLVWLIILAVAGSIAATAGTGAEPLSPSFTCSTNVSPTERIICADPKLAVEDRLMARLYALAGMSAFGRGPSNQAATQREWLRSRDQCGTLPAKFATECLIGNYGERNEQLALAVLLDHPEFALTELRRLDAEAAPMFEAIYLYARSKSLSATDRQRVVALLQPYKDTPGGWGEPSDAVKSDAAFAEFIGVRSAGMRGEDWGRRRVPCAAVTRKPKLIEATEPRFGSHMDSFVLQSDCEDTLPPLPRFSSLLEKRQAGMTDCGGGSIRYAYYRAFSNAATAARLATSAQLRKGPMKPFPPRRKVTSTDIKAALDELSAYYVRYGRAGVAEAPRLARQMIYNMLDQAWQC